MKLTTRTWASIASLLLLGLLAWKFAAILTYVFAAAVISLVARPLLKLLDRVRIRRRPLPDWLTAIVAMLVLVGGAMLLLSMLIPPVLQQAQELEQIDVDAIAQGLEEPLTIVEGLLHTYGIAASDVSIESYIQEKVVSVIGATRLSSLAGAIVGFTGDLFIGLFSVLFISFFFLKERTLLHDIVQVVTPDAYLDKVNNIFDTAKPLLTRYFAGLLLEVLLVGLLVALGLSLVGVRNALVIGFLAGLFNVIPYLGPLIGGALAVVLSLLGGLHLDFYTAMLPMVGKVLVVILIVQLIDNFVFQPLIYSNSVKAHPLEIFLVILMAGTLAGVGGMILAIPVYTLFRVVARAFFNQFKIIQSLTQSL
ncbi:MAG: AI-2E family transporter [Bacteroidia bacterium]